MSIGPATSEPQLSFHICARLNNERDISLKKTKKKTLQHQGEITEVTGEIKEKRGNCNERDQYKRGNVSAKDGSTRRRKVQVFPQQWLPLELLKAT